MSSKQNPSDANNTPLMQDFTKGLLKENPVLVMLLGMCPTLAVTTMASSAVGMGLATTFVLVCSNLVISLLKGIIPKVSLQIAKNLIKDEKYEEAAAQIEATSKLAAEFENDEIVAEAKELVPQMWLMKGKKAVELKDFAAAADAFTKSYDADTTNASTALTLAQVLGALGKTDQAVDVLQHAIWNGKEAEAKKQMGKLYVSQANAALKANKLADAVAAANKANDVEPNATACLIAGQASQKLGKSSDAIANFTKYLELQPEAKNANAITFTVAALYQQAKNNAKALEFYKKVADDPKYGAQAKQMIAALGK